jgi:hypothetical protein
MVRALNTKVLCFDNQKTWRKSACKIGHERRTAVIITSIKWDILAKIIGAIVIHRGAGSYRI